MDDIEKYNALTLEQLALVRKGLAKPLFLNGNNDHLYVLVDAEEYPRLNKYWWYMTYNNEGPVIKGRLKNTPAARNKNGPVVIGRVIMNVIGKRQAKGCRVRYKDGNPFISLKSNLELW